VKQWIGEADNMEAKDWGWSIEHNMCEPIRSSMPPAPDYRGITVLPVISKIVEAVIRDRIQPLIHNMQNPTQRGFTKGSSLVNAALPVEEAYRILTDEKQN
jgi:hypothetical protein